MNELLELRLEVLPGVIKAIGSVGPAAEGADRRSSKAGAEIEKQGEQGQRAVVTLRIPQWTPARKNEVLHQLAAHPGELYDLLQGSLNGGLAALELLPVDDELRLAAEEQGTGLLPVDELVQRVRQQLTQEPLLAFALRGLSKEELLSGVFALWAEQENERSTEEDAPASVSLASSWPGWSVRGRPYPLESGWLRQRLKALCTSRGRCFTRSPHVRFRLYLR